MGSGPVSQQNVPKRIVNIRGNIRRHIGRPTANNVSMTNPPLPKRRRIKVPNYKYN